MSTNKGCFLSQKIRSKSKEIIEKKGRPMAASELETYFRTREPKLWAEISKKCNDYIRIILSLAKNNMFPKFKSVYQIPDIDKRSIFFGSKDVEYDLEMWEFIPPKSESKVTEEYSISEPEENKGKEKEEEANVEVVPIESLDLTLRKVDCETAGNSWSNLSASLPMTDKTWDDITKAIYEIAEVYRNRTNSPDLLVSLYKKYKKLAQAKLRVDIENILMREIIIREQLQNSIYSY